MEANANGKGVDVEACDAKVAQSPYRSGLAHHGGGVAPASPAGSWETRHRCLSRDLDDLDVNPRPRGTQDWIKVLPEYGRGGKRSLAYPKRALVNRALRTISRWAVEPMAVAFV